MKRSFIVTLIAALLLVIFSVENAKSVDIVLWFWTINFSMALVIFISVILGIFLSYLLMISSIRSKEKTIFQKEDEIKKLKTQLKKFMPDEKNDTSGDSGQVS